MQTKSISHFQYKELLKDEDTNKFTSNLHIMTRDFETSKPYKYQKTQKTEKSTLYSFGKNTTQKLTKAFGSYFLHRKSTLGEDKYERENRIKKLSLDPKSIKENENYSKYRKEL